VTRTFAWTGRTGRNRASGKIEAQSEGDARAKLQASRVTVETIRATGDINDGPVISSALAAEKRRPAVGSIRWRLANWILKKLGRPPL
jgi:type II secretory pathway component PulF